MPAVITLAAIVSRCSSRPFLKIVCFLRLDSGFRLWVGPKRTEFGYGSPFVTFFGQQTTRILDFGADFQRETSPVSFEFETRSLSHPHGLANLHGPSIARPGTPNLT